MSPLGSTDLHRVVAPVAASAQSRRGSARSLRGPQARRVRRRPPPSPTVPGMPPVVDPANLYSETAAGKLSPAVAGDLPRVYVPNLQSQRRLRDRSGDLKVVDKFKVGLNPQHVVPS